MPPPERESRQELEENLTRDIQEVIGDLGSMRESVDKVEAKMNSLERDTLTGLLDRRQYYQRLRRKLESREETTVIMIDLNYLKYFNDGTNRGQAGGDEVLRKLAEATGGIENINYTPFRYGGDEFTIIVEGGAEEAQKIIDEVRRRVSELPLMQGSEFPLTISAGFALLDEAEAAFENLPEKEKGLKVKSQILSELMTNIASVKTLRQKKEFHNSLLEDLGKTDPEKRAKIEPFIIRARASQNNELL
jgi:diguanylate cyclase (GGDEF)-like protein